jgi:UDP-N-acetylglucosamine--N-acetylmuramyl-(pentapeptide) pyrophosphoryl-undecaprenol N-acetylglucosamine transferase
MRIVLTGGGSGGHITPILAVATELKKIQPDIQVVFIGQKGDSLADVPAAHPAIDAVYTVRAGKFRRYHGEGWQQVLDLETQLKNARDAIWVLAGIWQSFWLLHRLRPAVIFTRGGFVSVPVAIGGKLNGIRYITHDSDSTPSLANRIISRWAVLHAVALPAELYPYPKNKTVVVGVPVSREYVHITSKLQQQYKNELGLDQDNQVLLVTGGGNGAVQLNNVIIRNATQLLRRFPHLAIVHIAGRAQENAVNIAYDQLTLGDARTRVIVKGFIMDLYRYSGAADVIVVRGGATSLAEFAMQAKACVVIPAKQLVWQAHHAQALYEHHAIEYLDEEDSEQEDALYKKIAMLLDDSKYRHGLGTALGQLAHPDAARQLAMLLLKQAHEGA